MAVADKTIRWTDRLRRIPAGILLIAVFLLILGVGSIAASGYLLLLDGEASVWALATGLVGGPATIYLGYHLVRLAHWTWVTLIALILLLGVSSLLRLVTTPSLLLPPIAELIVEAGAALYLTRPYVRARFRR